MSESVDSTVLIELLKEVRSEMRNHRALLMESLDQSRTFERYMDAQLLALRQRIGELKEELEQTVKSELMLLIGNL